MSIATPLHVLFIDNFDSFTFNLVDEFEKRGCTVEVRRNSIDPVEALARSAHSDGPRLIVLSPGPGAPRDAGCCLDLVRLAAAGGIPLLGVCLGHQAIIEACGGTVERAATILHGRSAPVEHRGGTPFAGIASPFPVGRYHSLAGHDVPDTLEVSATSGGIVMAVRHRTAPLVGIQFHPESILTPSGGRLIENVMTWARGA